jgi:GTP-binding protein EngB required for normal cell division
LLGDPQLKKIVLLWDSRHAPVKADLDALPFFLDICEQKKIELLLVLTKTDQLKTQSERVQRKRIVDQFLKEQGLLGAPGFESVWVSVKSNEAKRAGKLLSNDGLSELLFKMTKLKVDKAEEVEEAETEETEGDL